MLDHHGSFGFPVVVSAAGRRASARASSLASDELELEAAVEEAFRCGDEVLVERLVDGRVVTVAVLDGTPLGALDLGALVALLYGRGPGAARPVASRGDARGDARLKARFAAARYRSLLRIAQQSCEALGVGGRGAGRVDGERSPERGGARRGRVAGARPRPPPSPASPPAPGWASRT